MTADVELMPCPFCGSTDALRLQNTHTASFWVSCCEDDGGCGAQATGQFFPGPNRRTRFVYDPEAPEGSTFEARTLGELPPEYRRAAKSAIAAWNRRDNVAHATAAKDAEIEALRAEVERLRTDGASAVRWAPSSSHWSAVLRELFGPNARDGIEVLENQYRQELARAERLAEALRNSANALERLAFAIRAPNARTPQLVELAIAMRAAARADQPAAVDGSYPAPRNRSEAAALARLALAYLGVIDAHIDAAIARCETNSAAQQQGGA